MIISVIWLDNNSSPPHLVCQAAAAGALSAAERSYPTSEVRGDNRKELPCIRGQGRRPRGATPCPRPGAAGRRHPRSEVRGGGQEELPRCRGSHLTPEARGGGPEEPSHTRGGATGRAVAVRVQEGLRSYPTLTVRKGVVREGKS